MVFRKEQVSRKTDAGTTDLEVDGMKVPRRVGARVLGVPVMTEQGGREPENVGERRRTGNQGTGSKRRCQRVQE